MSLPFDSLMPIAVAILGPSALASLRMLGILTLAPALGAAIVGWRMRVVLAMLLGGLAGTGHQSSPSDWAVAALTEFLFGALIGCGLSLFISGLRLAGELIDREIGVADAFASDPWSDDTDGPLGPCTRLLSGLAVVTVLFAGSTRGGFPILEGILESFVQVPVGHAFSGDWGTAWLVTALQQSAELAIRAALPVLSVMAILGWAQGLILRAAPQAPATAVASAVRPLLGLAVLVATFGGALESANGLMSRWFDVLASH